MYTIRKVMTNIVKTMAGTRCMYRTAQAQRRRKTAYLHLLSPLPSLDP